MSWFLKYRPKQIKDLDLTSVRQSFLQLMDKGKLPQTLLFAGPKGTGKTSTSRIIGAMLNDPANEKLVDKAYLQKKSVKGKLKEPNPESDFAQRVYCGQSFVVQEMDAASNRGIDDVRALKQRIALPPQEGKMAVYILDEVHMLTNEAFNALLKILEEPPAHVVFILATTELHKVPATIVSRCTLVSFHKASVDEIVGRLQRNLKAEKIKYEDEALDQIAQRADGSFRDAVKLAELAAQAGEITSKTLENVLGGSAEVKVANLIKAVLAKDEKKIGQIFETLRQENFDQDYFYKTFYQWLHDNLLKSLGVLEGEPKVQQKISSFLLKALLTVDLTVETPISFLPLELKLLELVAKAKKNSAGSSGASAKKLNKKKVEPAKEEKKEVVKAAAATEIQEDTENLFIEEVESDLELDKVEYLNEGDQSASQAICERWEELLRIVSEENITLASLLRSGKPKGGANGTAEVGVYYRFHQEQLQQPKFKNLIEKCGSQLLGSKISFKFVLANPPEKAELVDVPSHSSKLQTLAEETLM